MTLNEIQQKDISSAEMTACYRSSEPSLSGDSLSVELASEGGIAKAKAFIDEYDYPLVERKVSVRAGYALQCIIGLMSANRYDSCISFGSGFSLLTYYAAFKLHENNPDAIFIDTDLPHMIEERNSRINKINAKLDESIIMLIRSQALDLEEASRQGKNLMDIFPDCKKPVFILEGIIYFLSRDCVDWLFEQIASYDSSAMIIDYWPDDSVELSECFAKIFKTLDQYIPEQTKTFWDQATGKAIRDTFNVVTDLSIAEVEKQVAKANSTESLFSNQHQFFPVRMMVAEKYPTASASVKL